MPNDHDSRKSTEQKSYDRLRESGVKRDEARKIANDASVQTHRVLDKRESSR